MADLAQIENYLKQRGISYKVIDLGGAVYRVEEVIKTGVNPKEIVKTLIVRIPSYSVTSNRDKRKPWPKNVSFVALAVRGKDRVDFKKVRRLFGSKSELARPEEVEKMVGVPVGAVCPVLIGVPLIFDKQVMGLKRVNLGSGDLTKGLEMELADLLKAVGEYEVKDLV